MIRLADEALMDWKSLLKTKRIVDEEKLDRDEYAEQVALLKKLRAGQRVEITYLDSQRGGEVKTIREISYSWDDLREEIPTGFRHPQVLLEAKAKGQHKNGMIADYGRKHGVVWQPTLRTQVRQVLDLRKV
jgi:hypothetical protein